MAEVLFYHLERQTLGEVLPILLERSLERGWRVVVELADSGACAAFDRLLWTYRDDSFLPHGTVQSGRLARQPIVLTAGPDNPNGANVRIQVPTRTPTDVETYERYVIAFSADEEGEVARARSYWKPLKAAGHDCSYWRQGTSGRWERKG